MTQNDDSEKEALPAQDRGQGNASAFYHLVGTVRRLREPGGCPWDREQTHASLVRYMIEEAYEAADAMAATASADASSSSAAEAHVQEELGDVLYQVVLNAQIASEEGSFAIDDVCRGIDEKLVRRHPHVFSDVSADTPEQVEDIWARVKREEREASAGPAEEAEPPEQPGLLDSVPRSMPALMQCQKISSRAARAGFDWDDVSGVWDKVAEERAEFEAEKPGTPEREMEFGDLLFSLVNVARMEGIDAERALDRSNKKFRARWLRMERQAREQGVSLESLSTAELNEWWVRAKQEEKLRPEKIDGWRLV
ncbi:MAG: nucleoside triphosphate pyrophosphohydrolase [Tractidigestivibacter sp.]|jgi:MazG family protein|uniref:nucleoside triphosphate pyrophosphohydrolase n=1 Tax=Tractidigestivibacter sp. TaxID=2847320 RepID=UPI003D8BBEC0